MAIPPTTLAELATETVTLYANATPPPRPT